MCVGENATNKDHHQLVCNKLCFVINMLYNKINNHPAQSRRISPDFNQLSLWPLPKYQAIFYSHLQDNG